MKNKGRIISFFLIVLVFGGIIGLTTSDVSKNINLGLDLQGGFEVLYEVEPVDQEQTVSRNLLEGTVQTLNDRVNRLGISEANIDIEGEDRIRVQLAGVENQAEARDMLATSARLSFRDVMDEELLDGSDIKEGSAKQDFDGKTNQPIVTLELKDAKKFGEVTSQVKDMGQPNNLLVIWMDYEEGEDSFVEEIQKEEPKFISAPAVSQTLNTSSVQISGDFTVESAQRLASVINSGSLPVHMTEIFSTTVGAQFGEKALNKTIFAGFVGVGLIFLFVIGYYRFPGLIATVNLAIYVYLILLVFGLMNGVLTLPGIAALILGVGMAVDANVITFERIKEELRKGKTVMTSFKEGTKTSLATIVDANVTTLLAAVVLFTFGTSSIKGFATMLIVSIFLSFITSVFGTRFLLGLWVKSGFLKDKQHWFGVKEKDIRDLNDTSVVEPRFMGQELDIVSHRKKFFMTSLSLVVLGVIVLSIFKLNPGVDFSSGSRVEIQADTALSTESVESDLINLNLEPETIVISGEEDNIAVTRYDTVLTDKQEQNLKKFFVEKYGEEPSVSIVSPIVGEELVKNAVSALVIASIGMIVYVTLRFEYHFAFTSILTLLHDVFFMLVVFSIFRIEFDITIIAAILTIVGYSINNTIVVFDRIRENVRDEGVITSFEKLSEIVNRSLVQTIVRSLNTTITTLIAVLAFLFLGAESISGFAIALVIGLIAGTYSSLFLASQIWLVWRGRSLDKKPLDFSKRERLEGPQI